MAYRYLRKSTESMVPGINIINSDVECPKLEEYPHEGVYINGQLLSGVTGYRVENYARRTTLELHLVVNRRYQQDDVFIGMEYVYD